MGATSNTTNSFALKLNTLIVEDEEVFYLYLKKHLEVFDIPIKIERAVDGKDALQKLEQNKDGADRFDLMLTDISMPGMDGMELLRRLEKNTDLNKNLFMYVITGKATPQEFEDLKSFEFVKDVISKPVNAERLKMIVFPAFIHKARRD